MITFLSGWNKHDEDEDEDEDDDDQQFVMSRNFVELPLLVPPSSADIQALSAKSLKR